VLVSGLFSGFVLLLVFNVLPHSAAFFQTVHKKYLPPVLTGHFPSVLKNSFLNVVRVFTPGELNWLSYEYHSLSGNVIAYVIVLLLLVALISGRNRRNLGFLICAVVFPLFLRGFLSGSWYWFHYSVFTPFVVLSLAVSMFTIIDMFSKERVKKVYTSAFIMIFIVPGIWDIMNNNISMLKYDHHSSMNRVSEEIPGDSSVLGASLYYPAFIDSDKRFVGVLIYRAKMPEFCRRDSRPWCALYTYGLYLHDGDTFLVFIRLFPETNSRLSQYKRDITKKYRGKLSQQTPCN
jgi:hypothetical protein